MASYEPPAETFPIFDVSVFRSTNDNVITQEEANLLYLSRNGTASSLATSTSFLGPITTTGNLTLNGAIASNRQIEASYLKLVDNASATINKPLIWYPDPSLQITTNDFTSGTLRTIDLKSYDGTGTSTYSQFSCQYNRVTAQGNIRLTRLNDAARYSTFTMGATELTIANNYTGATPHINLTTPAAGTGNIITNSPFQFTNKADPTKLSTLTQGTSDFTIENSVASGNLILNTTTGTLRTNSSILLNHVSDPFKRSITSSIQYYSDYSTVSANTPNTLYYNNALITSTNDVATLQYINFNSFDGTTTNKYTTFQCGYNEYVSQGALKITQSTNFNNRTTMIMGANDFTLTNTNATGSILLNTTAGKIKYNSPIEPQVGSNPTTLAQIGGTTITSGSNINIPSAGLPYTSTSCSLTAGTYMLVGQVQYSLKTALPSVMSNYGCWFNDTVNALNTSTGTPYYASTNVILTSTTNSMTFTNLTAGPRMQTVMNINVTATTTVYLNFFLTYTNTGGATTFDVFGTIMVTRIA